MLAIVLLAQALTIAVGGPPSSPEYLPLRVAEAEGYFTREGLSVTLRSTRAESGAAEALAQGQADLAATSLEAILRFGHRPKARLPQLVLGLTAAPPVALLVSASHADDVRSMKDLEGKKIGFTSPGAPEQTWLAALLARARLTPTQVDLLALGSRGLVAAMDAGDVHAGIVPEPAASRLVKEGRASRLVALTSPRAVVEALGAPTVNAAVFVRPDRRPGDRDLAAFARAVVAAERLIARESPSALGTRLPRAVVGPGDEFERRVEATHGMYLPNGLVAPDAVSHTIEMIRAHLPLPQSLRVPAAQEILFLDPARRAVKPRR